MRRQVAPSSAEQTAERAHTPAGMVYVPGGSCPLGTDDADADDDVKPMRRAFVPSFYIDRTEVTNGEYRRFDPGWAYPAGEDDLPATNVTYNMAAAFARWAGKRLPTEEEWEKAARGTDGRRYPWGNMWDPKRVAARRASAVTPVNTNSLSGIPRLKLAPAVKTKSQAPGRCAAGPSRVAPVGSVSAGASPYGCVDMAGNAWEWVQGYYQGNRDMRVLRGGAVGYGERACRTYTRGIEGSGVT